MTLGHFALFSWPLVALIFFKKFPVPFAVFLTIFAGYLVLPEKIGVDLPVLPTLNKRTLPALAAFFFALMFSSQKGATFTYLKGFVPRSFLAQALCALLIFGAFMTVLTNTDTLRYGPTRLPGLRLYDAMSFIMTSLMFLLPIALARKYLATREAHRMILVSMVVAGLIYSLFVLIELRMSPLTHYWIYGFFPHSWAQHVRGGSWRPVVFLGHGLLLGIFLCGTVIAALGLSRIDGPHKKRFLMAALWLFFILAVSRNMGALMIATVLIGVVMVLPRKSYLVFALLIAGVFVSYPALRNAQVLPLISFAETIESYYPERGASLLTRFKNEDNFMRKIDLRPLFGWGGWGRARTYDAETGVDTTLADGAWIISLAVSGWFGYIAKFGLICGPIFLLYTSRRRIDLSPETSVLILILGGNLVDLLVNSGATPITGLIVGSLWGYHELATRERTSAARVQAPADGQAGTRTGTGRLDAPALNRASNGYTRQTKRIERVRRTNQVS